MSHRTLDSRHSIESCTFQLHSWRPFQLQAIEADPPKLLPSGGVVHHSPSLTKRPCLSNRATSFPADFIDMSKLSLVDDDKPIGAAPSPSPYKKGSLRLFERKRRRRRGSRSVSGRSSDRSGTRRCCSVGANCSDFPVAVGTDSSGELFGNGDANWSSDVSEAKNSWRKKEREREEREYVGVVIGSGQFANFDAQGNESGYGSEPGYRGDAEFGYGDEVDEEEEDARLLFWGDQFGDTDSKMDSVGENTFSDQKAHYRCRRKKHDCRMVDSLR